MNTSFMYDNIGRIYSGQFCIAKSPLMLKTTGIGSCIVIILYDLNSSIAGIAHLNYPESDNFRSPEKCVDIVLPELIFQLKQVIIGKLQAKLVGGATFYGSIAGSSNVDVARQILEEFEIEITGEDVLGEWSRSVIFDPDTGLAQVTQRISVDDTIHEGIIFI